VTYAATLEKITAEARSLSPARIAATVVTAPFFVIGWVVGLVFVAVALLWSAAVVGFRAGRDVSPRRRAYVERGGEPGRHID
jgi:hypothetical protein